MPAPDGDTDDDPIIQPRVIRLMKKRPRLIDYGLREEFWEQWEQMAVERRKPDTAVEKAYLSMTSRASEAVHPVLKNRVKNRAKKVNKEKLSRL